MKVIRETEIFEVAGAVFPRRRVVVLERDDGSFTFAEEYYSVSFYEGGVIAEGWARASTNGIYATADMAEAEALLEFARRWRLHI